MYPVPKLRGGASEHWQFDSMGFGVPPFPPSRSPRYLPGGMFVELPSPQISLPDVANAVHAERAMTALVTANRTRIPAKLLRGDQRVSPKKKHKIPINF